MTREEFDLLPSWRQHPCPDCETFKTHPTPNCHCPGSPTGYGTRHINRNHHTCPKPEPAPTGPVGPWPCMRCGKPTHALHCASCLELLGEGAWL